MFGSLVDIGYMRVTFQNNFQSRACLERQLHFQYGRVSGAFAPYFPHPDYRVFLISSPFWASSDYLKPLLTSFNVRIVTKSKLPVTKRYVHPRAADQNRIAFLFMGACSVLSRNIERHWRMSLEVEGTTYYVQTISSSRLQREVVLCSIHGVDHWKAPSDNSMFVWQRQSKMARHVGPWPRIKDCLPLKPKSCHSWAFRGPKYLCTRDSLNACLKPRKFSRCRWCLESTNQNSIQQFTCASR